MEAEHYFKQQLPNMRELWNLSYIQKKMILRLMDGYKALHIADVMYCIGDLKKKTNN